MACDHDPVTDYDKERQNAALAELDTLTAAFKAAEAELSRAREAVQEAIVRHLRERNAPPGKIAEHSPYDRNHVGRIRDAAKIPPLRTSTVKSIKAETPAPAAELPTAPPTVSFLSASDRTAELIAMAGALPSGRHVELVSLLEKNHWAWLRANRLPKDGDRAVVQKAIKAGLFTTSDLMR